MPVHFNSFIPDKEEKFKTDLFANMITKYTETADDIFVSDDKKQIHMTSYFKNSKTGENEGKVVITLIVREDAINVVDTDITLLSKNKVKLNFETKLEESSESNEYYEVFDLENERHFEIETVNRYSLKQDNIEGTVQEVYLSCFPFQMDLFDSQEELDKRFGLSKEIDVPGLGKQRFSMGSDFIAVGGAMFQSIKEPCSFIIGKIIDYRDVEVIMADIKVNFTIIDLETGVGVIPVAVHERNFDIRKIAKEKLIGMLTDVKADFREPDSVIETK